MAADAEPETPTHAPPAARVLGVAVRILLGLAVAFVAFFVGWIVAHRLSYPFELEWMEGAMADHVARLLEGELLYAPPTYEHVAFLYHPGYFYAAALFGLVTGPGFLALRLVSIVATVGTCVLLFRLVKRDGSALGGVTAIGVFLGAFSLAGCYYDIGRIDPLFTFLLLGGIDQARSASTWRGLAVAVLWFLGAWLTKQTAAVVVPIIVLGCIPGGFKKAVVFGLAVAVTCGATELLLDAVHDGWLWFFTIELPRNHGYQPEYVLHYFINDLPPLLPCLLLFGVFAVRSSNRRLVAFHAAWVVAAMVGSGMSRVHVGGAENVLIPMIAALAAAGGLGVAHCGAQSWRLRCGAEALAVVQIGLLFMLPFFLYPFPYAPTPQQRQRAELLLEEIRVTPAPVFVPWHGYLTRMAGKPATAHTMAMDDVWRSGNPEVIARLDAALRDRFAQAPAPVIYIDDATHPQLRQLIVAAGYGVGKALGDDRAVKQPVGSPIWPRLVMVKP